MNQQLHNNTIEALLYLEFYEIASIIGLVEDEILENAEKPDSLLEGKNTPPGAI